MTWKRFYANWGARLLAGAAVASALGLGTATSVAYAQYGAQSTVTPPAVPDNLKVLDGSIPFQIGHATGTQNYICLPADGGFKYVLFTPQATLFDGDRQLTTHFFSPNPDEGGTIRATWQDSR